MNRDNTTKYGWTPAQTRLACLGLLFFLAPLFSGAASMTQGKEEAELQRVLNKMDSIARSFRTFSARFSQKKYTAVLKEFDAPETGEFYYARAKDGSVQIRHEVTSPSQRILTIKGSILTVYRPAIKEAQIASREKMQDVVEYLALGIGQYSAKLREKFKISYQGSESVNDAECDVLVFAPKDPKAAARVESITIWLKKSSGMPVRYKFQEPTKDYLQIDFTDEKLNAKIPGSKFEQKLPPGVEIQKL